MKQRCEAALNGSAFKVFGLREEHRVSVALFSRMSNEFVSRGVEDEYLRSSGHECKPFYAIATPALLSFLYSNINKFCVGFEMVHSLNDRHSVTWEHTRIMLMFLRCFQFSYGGALLQRVSGCWRDVWEQPDARRQDGLRRCEGMGMGRNMSKYGYAWMKDKVDWDTMTFKHQVAPYITLSNPSMQGAYRANYHQVRDVRRDFLLANQVGRWLKEFSAVPACLDLLEAYLTELCLCVFRKDVFNNVRGEVKPECLESALAGEVALSCASLNHVLRDEAKPLQLALGNRVAVKNPSSIVSWLWGWRDAEFERHGWDDLPYRMLAKQSFGLIERSRGKAHARVWRRQVQTTFIQGHWLLPYPHARGFMRKGKDGSVLWWSAINEGLNRYYQKFYKHISMPRTLPCEFRKHHPTAFWVNGNPTTPHMEHAHRRWTCFVLLKRVCMKNYFAFLTNIRMAVMAKIVAAVV